MLKADETLKDFKKKNIIDFDKFEEIFMSLAKILGTIHKQNVIHRDLKPANIFYINKKLVVGDFDIAKFDDASHLKLQNTGKNERLANYHFSAPEQSEKEFEEITSSADLYAFGQILYWLITNKTLRGQSEIKLTEFDKRYEKYENLLKNLLQQEVANRIKSIDEVFKHLEEYENTQSEYIKIENNIKTLNIKTLEVFDEIIDKYTPDILYQEFKMFDDRKNINDIMTDLSINCDILKLWWSQGYYDNHIKYIKKYESLSLVKRLKEKFVQNTKWILGDFEIEVESIWLYKYGDLGGSFIIIESKPMESFGIFNNRYKIEEAALFKNRYIPKSHYDNGWTEYRNKRIKIDSNCEYRRRHLYKDIFFIAPWAGPIVTKKTEQNIKIINNVYERYHKGSELNDSLLEILKDLRRKDDIVMWS